MSFKVDFYKFSDLFEKKLKGYGIIHSFAADFGTMAVVSRRIVKVRRLRYSIEWHGHDTLLQFDFHFNLNGSELLSASISELFEDVQWSDEGQQIASEYTDSFGRYCSLSKNSVTFRADIDSDNIDEYLKSVPECLSAIDKLDNMYNFIEDPVEGVSDVITGKHVSFDVFLGRLFKEFGAFGLILDKEVAENIRDGIHQITIHYQPNGQKNAAYIIMQYMPELDSVVSSSVYFYFPSGGWNCKVYEVANEFNAGSVSKLVICPECCYFTRDTGSIEFASTTFEASDVTKYLPDYYETLNEVINCFEFAE